MNHGLPQQRRYSRVRPSCPCCPPRREYRLGGPFPARTPTSRERTAWQELGMERTDVSLLYSSLVRRIAEESGQVETDSKIHRVERKADGTRVADGQIDNVEGAGLKPERETIVARDVGGANRFGRSLEHAAAGSTSRPARRARLAIQELAEHLLLP